MAPATKNVGHLHGCRVSRTSTLAFSSSILVNRSSNTRGVRPRICGRRLKNRVRACEGTDGTFCL